MNNKKSRIFIVCTAFFIILGTTLSIWVANYRATSGAYERAEKVLLDSAREQAQTFSATMGGQVDVLESLAMSMTAVEYDTPESIETFLFTVAESTELRFSIIDFIYKDGTVATGDDAHNTNVSGSGYFTTAISGKPAMEYVYVDGADGCLVLAVPYYKDGEINGVVRGMYYEQALRSLLASQVYGGEGYSLVIRANGDIVINAENTDNVIEESNLFDFLAGAEFQNKSDLDHWKNDLGAGMSEFIHYEVGGSSRIAVITPLPQGEMPDNDWSIINIINEKSLRSEISTGRGDTLESIEIFAVFAALAMIMLILIERDYRLRKRLESEQAYQREEQFRIVTQQSEKFVIRYDITTRRMVRIDDVTNYSDEFSRKENSVDEIINHGALDSVSVEDFRELFDKINSGVSPVTADILMATPNGQRRWYKYISTTIFDKNGRPKTAVISYVDNTEQRERELAYAKWQQELDSIPLEYAALYEWNLTKNMLESRSGVFSVNPEKLAEMSFDGLTVYFAEKNVFEDDRDEFVAMLNREHLIALYLGKVYNCAMDFRYITETGELRWHRMTVQLVIYPDSGDIKAYLTNRDINEEKEKELALVARTQNDFLTGALNRETFLARVGEVIARSPDSTHAFFMLDVDGFKLVNDTLGHDMGDKVLGELVNYVRAALRAGDLVGRLGGDEFMVCLPEMIFDASIGKKAAQLCDALRRQLDEGLNVSVSIGVAVYPRDGTTFNELYRHADAALYQAKTNKDSYVFYQPGMDSNPDNHRPESTAAQDEAQCAHTVVIVSDSDESALELETVLRPQYEPQRITEAKELMALLSGGSMIHAAIIDVDTASGLKLFHTAGKQLSEAGLELYAVSCDSSKEAYLRFLNVGASLVFLKPVNRELMQLRLDRLYSAEVRKSSQIQSAYRRLQNTDEIRYREVLNATGTTVFVYDVATKTYQVDLLNTQATTLELLGRSLTEETQKKGVISSDDAERVKKAIERIGGGEKERESLDFLLLTKDGSRRWFRMQIIKMNNAGTMTQKLLLIVNDVNEQVMADEELRYRAQRDALTGLYNRETFFAKAAGLIAAHEPGYYVMACFDIDNFKVINDQYGTKKGDEVLTFIADTFRNGFGKTGAICCRVMADSFAVLYPISFVTSDEISRVRRTASVQDGSIPPISFSIGRYIVDDLSLSVSAMLDRAAIAEASIKGRFDKHIAHYRESMLKKLLEEQETINEMKSALELGQFEPWFQPQFNRATGEIIGAEALVRWRHPQKGLILPGEFIPIFERNGFIYQLDRFMWESACALLKRWQNENRPQLPLSVNVSRYDLFRDDIYEVICGLVEKYQVPVTMLHLEITESAFAKSTNQIVEVVKKLKDYGFTIEIDDFGSGYSSLNTLKDVPAGVLKLDMRFLANDSCSDRSKSILASVVDMAKRLHMPVIAEGVETVQQADYLQSIGCQFIQGYLYAKPMPLEEYEGLNT